LMIIGKKTAVENDRQIVPPLRVFTKPGEAPP